MLKQGVAAWNAWRNAVAPSYAHRLAGKTLRRWYGIANAAKAVLPKARFATGRRASMLFRR